MNPKISFVIPIYNEKIGLVKRSIRSCKKATGHEYEIIIVDDGSDKPYLVECDKYIRYGKNKGHAGALNVGIRNAEGEYISWIGADDYWYKYGVDKLVECLDEDRDVGLAYGNFKLKKKGEFLNVNLDEYSLRRLERNNYIGQFVIYRKDMLYYIGEYNEKYKVAQDWEYWLRMARFTDFKKVDVMCGVLSENPKGLALGNYDLCTEEVKDICSNLYPNLKYELKGHGVIW